MLLNVQTAKQHSLTPLPSMFYQSLLYLSLIAVLSDIFLPGAVYGLSSTEVDEHLEKGKKLLAAGQLADALSHFHSAIDGDPKNYVAYFRRATVYLGMGKSKSALPDLSKVVELKPDFTAARIQRANVYLKQGDFEAAKEDFETILQTEPNNDDARKNSETLSTLINDAKQAEKYYKEKKYSEAIDILSRIIEHCPWSIKLRELRADSYLNVNDFAKAVTDLKTTAKLIPDNTAAFLRISELLYQMGEAEDSLNNIRECLKLDPDHKQCHTHYTKIKKLAKQIDSIKEFINTQKWSDCIEKSKQILKLTDSQSVTFVYKAKNYMCTCYSKSKAVKESIKICTEILDQYQTNDVDALVNRAEAYILDEQYELALKDYQKAHEFDDSQRIHDGIKRIQKLIKQSKKRDYYKILGIRRSANKAEILRAYRKHAIKWHPDKYEGEDKKKAEKMFIDIAAAKEVLTDPEKRAKFDNGEDPLDAEEQAQQGGFNPFGQGFNPFGGGNGGGFTFRFHFN
ncbi:unnamed protein product [Didymodactylos carnosus]|uniref:J domain-containing protein n=1 Tax=Didymodactylos carnosus TaxID=1234261 RepID=A0A814D7W7_9BILA|nr:unnamed protein product [Didymodactylos carnosus]CAF0950099.1 unnamed protein product [Didymodactylos carnosus]CAF3706124.1 unnamed protein product [Didymodactylos carnosus]CAF3725793.1 unnamed protein product [Didymodactylos carnosus]